MAGKDSWQGAARIHGRPRVCPLTACSVLGRFYTLGGCMIYRRRGHQSGTPTHCSFQNEWATAIIK
eukprot:6181822-Prymnesium_polylepis.2